jgi:hypothetical protein
LSLKASQLLGPTKISVKGKHWKITAQSVMS